MNTLQAAILSYLLNSLWQVPLVFAAAWLAARSARRTGPATEHRIWVAALLLELVLPACSFTPAQILSSLMRLAWWRSPSETSAVHITIISGPVTADNALHLPIALLSTIVAVYISSALYFAARLVWGLRQTARLRRRAQPIVLTGTPADYWTRCSQHFDVHNAFAATSSKIAFPMTVGARHRVLLLPAYLPETLHEDDLHAAIAHEFAHMSRYDFALNLLYRALAVPIAWHPLLWLTRTRLEQSREMLCDTLAAESLGNPCTYARSLLRIAALLLHTPPAPTLHAIGLFETTIFERRIMNLTHRPTTLPTLSRLTLLAACVALGLATCTSALALHFNVGTPAFQAASTPPSSSIKGAAATGNTLHVSGRVINGNRINFVQPVYPPDAKAAKIQGAVVLSARIGKDGQIASLHVVSGPPELTQAAWGAVKQWTYKPYLLNGQPTEVDTTITVNFSLAAHPNVAAPAVNAANTPSTQPDETLINYSLQPDSVAAPNLAHGTTRPLILFSVQPIYPAAERNKGKFDGTVTVSLVVNQDGMPTNVAVKKGLGSDFDQSAIEAVRQYRFRPAQLNGNPVDHPLYIDMRFQEF